MRIDILKIFRIIISLLLFSSCFDSQRQCEDYKTGTFQFSYIVDSVEKTRTFTRTDSLNIDYFEGKVDSASVRWINNCEFIQKKLNPKSLAEQEAIHFKILTTTDSSYTFEYKLAVKRANRKQRVEKGTAYRIN